MEGPETLETIGARLRLLSKSVDERFEQVDRRFEQVDRRFEQIDGRFEQIDGRFEQIDGRFEQIDGRFEQIDGRFEQIDGRFDEVKTGLRVEIEAVASRLDLMVERLDDFLRWYREQIGTQKQMLAALDNHEIRITALEQRPSANPS